MSGTPSGGAGSAAVEAARSIFAKSPPKRARISQGKSLWPSMSGVCARTRSMRPASVAARAMSGAASSTASGQAAMRPARTAGHALPLAGGTDHSAVGGEHERVQSCAVAPGLCQPQGPVRSPSARGGPQLPGA